MDCEAGVKCCELNPAKEEVGRWPWTGETAAIVPIGLDVSMCTTKCGKPGEDKDRRLDPLRCFLALCPRTYNYHRSMNCLHNALFRWLHFASTEVFVDLGKYPRELEKIALPLFPYSPFARITRFPSLSPFHSYHCRYKRIYLKPIQIHYYRSKYQ